MGRIERTASPFLSPPALSPERQSAVRLTIPPVRARRGLSPPGESARQGAPKL